MRTQSVGPFVLEGRWVRLEPLMPAHVPALLAAAGVSRETYGLTTVPETAEAMTAYVETALREQEAGRAVPFATVDRASGVVVGATRFGNIERWDWPCGAPPGREGAAADAAEIGWTWLAVPAQRTAINSEAKLLMLSHAFEAWRVLRVHLKTDARNARSRAAIERLGARLDGVLRAHMAAADGGVRDSAWYSILAEEWPDVKVGLEAKLAARRPATLV